MPRAHGRDGRHRQNRPIPSRWPIPGHRDRTAASPLAAREREVGVGRQAVRSARTGEPCPVDARFDSRDEAVPQSRQSCRPGLEVVCDEVDGGGEGHGAGDVEGARAHAAFLSPPWRMGVGLAARSSRSAPIPTGPPILCAVIVIAVALSAVKSSGICPSACTASMWKERRVRRRSHRSRRSAAECRSRCSRPSR